MEKTFFCGKNIENYVKLLWKTIIFGILMRFFAMWKTLSVKIEIFNDSVDSCLFFQIFIHNFADVFTSVKYS